MNDTTKPAAPAGKPHENTQTEADAKSISGHADDGEKSSHDEKSHTKAGQDTGAGGGKKQERKH